MSALDYCKFRTRIGLTRLGLWNSVEHWRLKRRFRHGRVHESEFAIFAHFEGMQQHFIDVGANLGQSALSFRVVNRSCPIVSFEPNPAMEPSLRRVRTLLGESFQYRLHGLGSETAIKTLYVPMVKGIAFSQLATFQPGLLERNPYVSAILYEVTCCRHFDVVEQSLPIVRFDELGLRPGIVKIDAEGGETDVLQGMEQTLKRDRPVLMTEGTGARVFLLDRGYQMLHHCVAENYLHRWKDGDVGLNYFFVPGEKLTGLERTGVIGPRCGEPAEAPAA